MDGPLAPEAPEKPRRLRDLRPSTWWGVLKRAGVGFLDDNCTDWAASLTYYGVLSLFPAAIVVVALVGLVAPSPTSILDFLRGLVPADVLAAVQGPITEVATRQTSARVLLSFGLVGAIWSASAYVGAFTRASNAIYEVREGRKWYVLRPLQLLLTVVALVLMAISAFALLISGPIAKSVSESLNVGEAPLKAFQIARWPVLVLIAIALLSLLFWMAPNVRQPRFRWLTVGGGVALFVWLVMSAGFGVYVANFGSYDRTYGSLGAIIVFLVWLYLSNCAVMLGVEINAELERGRQLQVGQPVDQGPVLPPKTNPGTAGSKG